MFGVRARRDASTVHCLGKPHRYCIGDVSSVRKNADGSSIVVLHELISTPRTCPSRRGRNPQSSWDRV